ncbi:MAG: response regulator, partial [Candidatus Omnitrophica bacterium]|nr:response regulator [Candidatus Omnitrophota bacterium]
MKKHVLVVDDEQPIRELLKFKLANRGYEVATAKSADEFWQTALGSQFDLIILDIWLKGKLGTDVYCDLLEFGLDRKIPVVFVTALAEDFPPSHVKSGSQYAIYGKPLDLDRLIHDIDVLLAPG